jgi:WD40 repeat protein
LSNNTAKAVQLPEGEYGIYGMEKGSDGKIYFSSFTGKLHAYDIDKNELQCICQLFEEQLVWGSGVSRKFGRVYMGVYPTGEFYQYDLQTGTHKAFKTVKATKGCYARYFKELHNGCILVMTTGATHAWSVFDPATETLKTFEISESINPHRRPMGRSIICLDDERILYSTQKGVCCFNWKEGICEDVYIETDSPFYFLFAIKNEFFGMVEDGSIYQFDKTGLTPVMNGFPEGNIPMNIHVTADNSLVAAGDNGLIMKFDLKSGLNESFMLPNKSTKGLALHALKKHPKKNIAVGSQFINTQIFKLDTETGKSVSSLHKIHAKCGQVNCCEIVDDKYYLGIYGGAYIAEYDPEREFVYGENPREVAKIGQEQNRPVSMATKDGLIYMITKANYSALGGALTVFDPKTGRMNIYRNFIKDQNPNSMFMINSQLVGTTEIFADQKTHPGKAEEALVYVWDMNTEKLLHTSTPYTGCDILTGIAMSPAGKMLGTCAKGFFVFDSKELSFEYLSLTLPPTKGLFIDETTFMGATADKLYLLDIVSGDIQYLADFKGTGIFEQISDNEFLFDRKGELFKLQLYKNGA